jgi:succinate dehydrogenase hydrophobic anchor subunit
MAATPTNLADTTGSAAVDFEPEETNRGSLAWVYQAISGALVLVLITLHMVAQHFVVSTGLRNFADVIAWLSSPIMVMIEVLFLVVVTWHGLLGLRAVIFDFGLSERSERAITRVLYVVWAVTVIYGVWLLYTVINFKTA